MSNVNHFVIENNATKPLDLYIEPEGALFPLAQGEKVTVREHFTKSPVNVVVSTSEAGNTEVSIWPGDGEVRVEKDGVDVLDLIQDKGVGVLETAGKWQGPLERPEQGEFEPREPLV
jgi:hypothetical protein